MGQRLQVDTDHCSPAPNAYTLTDTLASTPGKTFGLKNDIDTGIFEIPLRYFLMSFTLYYARISACVNSLGTNLV